MCNIFIGYYDIVLDYREDWLWRVDDDKNHVVIMLWYNKWSKMIESRIDKLFKKCAGDCS
jgi:hypothetical protein